MFDKNVRLSTSNLIFQGDLDTLMNMKFSNLRVAVGANK